MYEYFLRIGFTLLCCVRAAQPSQFLCAVPRACLGAAIMAGRLKTRKLRRAARRRPWSLSASKQQAPAPTAAKSESTARGRPALPDRVRLGTLDHASRTRRRRERAVRHRHFLRVRTNGALNAETLCAMMGDMRKHPTGGETTEEDGEFAVKWMDMDGTIPSPWKSSSRGSSPGSVSRPKTCSGFPPRAIAVSAWWTSSRLFARTSHEAARRYSPPPENRPS